MITSFMVSPSACKATQPERSHLRGSPCSRWFNSPSFFVRRTLLRFPWNELCSATMCGLRYLLRVIGLLHIIGLCSHACVVPLPVLCCARGVIWATHSHRSQHGCACACEPGPTRVALHPCRMVEEPERQPYVRWTTCYDFEETWIIDVYSCRTRS